MKNYAGLDVSLKEVSVCVVDEDGKVVARGVAPADPSGVAGWLKNRSLTPERTVHESGMLSIWLQRGFAALGLPATCIDARKAVVPRGVVYESRPSERPELVRRPRRAA